MRKFVVLAFALFALVAFADSVNARGRLFQRFRSGCSSGGCIPGHVSHQGAHVQQGGFQCFGGVCYR